MVIRTEVDSNSLNLALKIFFGVGHHQGRKFELNRFWNGITTIWNIQFLNWIPNSVYSIPFCLFNSIPFIQFHFKEEHSIWQPFLSINSLPFGYLSFNYLNPFQRYDFLTTYFLLPQGGIQWVWSPFIQISLILPQTEWNWIYSIPNWIYSIRIFCPDHY